MGVISRKSIVLIGVGGGVAAYKSVAVASSIFQKGFDTYVAMTPAAQKFVQPLTFSAVIGRSVLTALLPERGNTTDFEEIYPHLFPATRADICVIVPATADLIAKICHGHANEIVSASALSLPEECRRYFCPAMNLEMWNQKIVQKNILMLEERGWQRIGPNEGHLACGSRGAGRMAESDNIVRVISDRFNDLQNCKNKRFLILSGPTLEHIDPVRFVSNHSSGKMGKALAEAASLAGADVDFITGPVSRDNLPDSANINVQSVTSAKEMLDLSIALFPQVDVAIFAAAVADFTPSHPLPSKLPKPTQDFSLKLTSTADIASTLAKTKHRRQRCIGFALETSENAIERARNKLVKKELDAVILNGPDSFNANDGNFCFISAMPDRELEEWGRMNKSSLAKRLIDEIARMLASE